jgi:hypothetical protein
MRHPKMIFSSSSLASANSLFLVTITSREIGSFGCFGCAVAWIASRPAAADLARLSVPGMSTVRGIMSSMYLLWVPTKGAQLSIVLGDGTKFWVANAVGWVP